MPKQSEKPASFFIGGKWTRPAVITAILWMMALASLSVFALPANQENKSGQSVPPEKGAWRFIVSGDSRNCGDIVVPAIAADGAKHQPAFYWHLGDLRAIYKVDEDMAAEAQKKGEYLSCESYLKRAWPDYIERQIAAFGPTRFYLGIGNHEVIPPKTVEEFSWQFEDWLLAPRRQMEGVERAAIAAATSGPCKDIAGEPYVARKTYYHWIQGGVDFIYLDNSSGSFPAEQLAWFSCILSRAEDPKSTVRTVVVGMHEVLPYSIANNHSMCDDPAQKTPGCESGKFVYEALLQLKKKKTVYVLASHSHFYLHKIFDREPAGHRLDGWIVGTAGAVRYDLPPGVEPGPGARRGVYGYLLGTVNPDGKIDFEFNEVNETNVPPEVLARYPAGFPNWCFAHNSQYKDPQALETTNRCTPVLSRPMVGADKTKP